MKQNATTSITSALSKHLTTSNQKTQFRTLPTTSKSKLSCKRTYLLNKIVISLVRHRVMKYVMRKLWIRIGEREYIIFLGCKFQLVKAPGNAGFG